MKSVLAAVSLSLVSACAFAAQPAVENKQACVAPVFPSVSTSSVGVSRIQKSINQWNDCVVGQPTDANKQLDAEVKAQSKKWVAATLQYFGGLSAGEIPTGRHEHERITPRLAFHSERAKLQSLSLPADWNRSHDGRTDTAPEPQRELAR